MPHTKYWVGLIVVVVVGGVDTEEVVVCTVVVIAVIVVVVSVARWVRVVVRAVVIVEVGVWETVWEVVAVGGAVDGVGLRSVVLGRRRAAVRVGWPVRTVWRGDGAEELGCGAEISGCGAEISVGVIRRRCVGREVGSGSFLIR